MTDMQIEARQRELTSLWTARNGGDYCGCYKHITPEEEREHNELEFREMIISAYCYGTLYDEYDEKTATWGCYGAKYRDKLGEERALEVFRDQVAFMRKHATIKSNVYTDHEGCSYNSIVWS